MGLEDAIDRNGMFFRHRSSVVVRKTKEVAVDGPALDCSRVPKFPRDIWHHGTSAAVSVGSSRHQARIGPTHC